MSCAMEIPDELDARSPGMAPSDVILVFSTRLERPAEIAAELFHVQVAPVVVVTGGASRQADDRVESRHHEAILRRLSVPSDAILVEDRSSHTGENVDFALEVIAAHGITPRAVAAVAKVHHRRALITLAHHSAETHTIFSATYPAPLTDERRAKELAYFAGFRRNGVDCLRRTPAGWGRTAVSPRAQ